MRIRVITRRTDSNPLAGYLTEIMAIEGFLGHDTVDVTDRALSADLLEGRDLLLLASMPLDAAEQEALAGYVRRGGRLIALRPPVEMAPLFGLKAAGSTLKRGHYLQLDESGCPAGALSTDVPLQVHAEADCYQVAGAEVAAWFCWGNGARRQFPAVAAHRVGDGMAAMLAFDLAGSTVLFHQGLPEQASTGPRPDPGGLGQYKPDGHFVGHLDVTRAHISQADLQQRLLSAQVDRMLPAPMPRLWYFPEGEPCLAFLNGDSDAMELADLEAVLAVIEPHCGKYTCYVMDEAPLEPAVEERLRARGHSFGKHVWAGGMPALDVMAAAVSEQMAGFRSRYGYTPLSHRGHCLIWPGWTEMAQYLARAGVRMDTNFVGAHCGHGYLTGSGLPTKFMDERGRLIDVYEQSTQWEDDVAIGEYFEQMPREQAIAASLETLRAAREQYHTVVNFNFHPIHTRAEYLDTSEWIAAVAGFCRDHGMPMIGGDDWVRFNDARRRVEMADYSADAASRRVRFRLRAQRAVHGLTLTLPAAWAGASFERATADGVERVSRVGRVHGAERAFIVLSLADGESSMIEITYRHSIS
jgi:hypothetical protein